MRTCKVIWTPQSQEDLREIRRFIARDAPVSAELFIQRLRSAVTRLRQFPESGSVVPELGKSNVREVFHGAYRIIYRIGPDRVHILTVFHGARLFDQDRI